MEELELLKKDWNKNNDEFRDYPDQEIYEMIKKRSVSVTKILLIIGLIEISLWSAYGYLDGGFPYLRMALFTIFMILAVFLFQRIKGGQNSIALMKNIFKVRRLVLGYAVISFLLIVWDNMIHFDHYTRDAIAGWKDGVGKDRPGFIPTDTEKLDVTFGNYIAFAVLLLIAMYILYQIYKTTYGKILQNLRKNYKELNQQEEKSI